MTSNQTGNIEEIKEAIFLVQKQCEIAAKIYFSAYIEIKEKTFTAEEISTTYTSIVNKMFKCFMENTLKWSEENSVFFDMKKYLITTVFMSEFLQEAAEIIRREIFKKKKILAIDRVIKIAIHMYQQQQGNKTI